MPTKIVLTVEEGLTEEEANDLRYLLTDALGEFADRRTPAQVYVEKRYPDLALLNVPTSAFEAKCKQVERRNAIAKKLHNVALHCTVENAS